MFTRKAALTTGLALLVAGYAMAGMQPSRTYLTFSDPVRLPGVTLGAGTYVFETPELGLNVVRILDAHRSQVYFMGFTERTAKPIGIPMDRQITFRESPANAPPTIDAWYPWDASMGHRFIYPRAR